MHRAAKPRGPKNLLAGLAVLAMIVLAAIYGLPQALAQDDPEDDPWEGTPQEAFLEGPIVEQYQCVTCHTITDQGGTVGPILNQVGLRRSEDWLRRWLEDPNTIKPGTKMPKFPFSREELEATTSALAAMKRPLQTDEILAGGATPEEVGKALFADYDCYACHRIGDEGRFVGPDLTWVGLRKRESWERVWLSDPPGFKPDTFMPDFEIPQEGVRSLAAYLHTLRGQANDAGRRWEYQISFMINTDAPFRGEMVWKRLGCWACHGENGRGGIANPNATAGHETVPDMKSVRDNYDREAFLAKITRGSKVPPADPQGEIVPYYCPPYPADALNRQGLDDLYAYVSSLAPPKMRWIIK